MTSQQWLEIILAAGAGVAGSGGLLGYLASRSQEAGRRLRRAERAEHRLEDYANRLRRQLTDNNIVPEEWPDE